LWKVFLRKLLSGDGDSGLFREGGCLVGGFPGEVFLGAAEVAVGCGLAVDGPAQVQALDNALGVSEKFLRTSSVSLVSLTLPVPKVSTRTLTGSATPMA